MVLSSRQADPVHASTAPLPLTVLILCGGSGERLGGIDKPLRALAGQPLIERVLAALPHPVDQIVISANRNREQYARYADRVVDDGPRTGIGPLAGIAAGLAIAGNATVLCAPGDAPLLPRDLLRRLDDARRAAERDIAVVDDGSGWQPLCLLLPRTALAALAAFIDGGGRAVHAWLASLRPAVADCSDWPGWGWSLNTEDEWAAVERNLLA
jgi:molybdopterin-guanine dinucleotide biosynthesis protein A